MRKTLFFLLFSFSVSFANLFAQDEGVTVTTANGIFTRCFPDTLIEVKIDVPPGHQPVDSFRLRWCQDCTPISIPGGDNPPNQRFRYALSNLYENNCSYDDNCLESGICFSIDVIAFNADGTRDNNGFEISFRFPPEPDFEAPNTICAENQVNFQNETCPKNDPSMTYLWDYGDGSPPDDLGIHTYPDTGTYRVTLTAMNNCNTKTRTKSIRVLGIPQAEVNFNPENGGRDTICVGDVISLDGSGSRFATSYLWTITGGRSEYVDSTDNRRSRPRVRFSEPNRYTIRLRVDNDCREPSEFVQEIVVIEAPRLDLDPQPDACRELSYMPAPFDPLATYRLNDSVITEFPVLLASANTPYTIRATLNNECGEQVRRDTFRVADPIPFSIVSPAQDTAVCVGSDSVFVLLDNVDPSQGRWLLDGQPFSPPFFPGQTGDFEVEYVVGTGDCETSDIVAIAVEGIDIIAPDIAICENADTFRIAAEPQGGVFSSVDCRECIDSSGLFDPGKMPGNDAVIVNYAFTSDIGCSSAKDITISVDQPVAGFEVAGGTCEGEPVDVDRSATIAEMQVWTIDGAQVPGPPFLGLEAGLHRIELTARTGTCTDTAARTIEIIAPPPPARIAFDQIRGCSPLRVDFSAAGGQDAEAVYRWQFGRSPSDTATAFDPADIEYENVSDEIRFLPVILEVSNTCLTTFDSLLVEVKPKPKAVAGTIFNSYCSGDTVEVFNASRGPEASFQWFYDGARVSVDSLPPLLSRITDARIQVDILLIATNECGPDTSQTVLTFEPTDARAAFGVVSPEFCVDDTIRITNLANTDDVLYLFDNLSESNEPNPYIIFGEPGIYDITQKAFGCGFDSSVVQLTIHPKPEALFFHPLETCPQTAVTMDNRSVNAVSHTWKIDGEIVSTARSPVFSFDSLGFFSIGLEIESTDGCRHQYQSEVRVVEPPVAQFSVPDSVCAGAPFEALSEASGNFSGCRWLIDGAGTTDGCEPVFEIAESGFHNITQVISNGIGCESEAEQTVFVRPTPEAGFDYTQDFTCSPVTVFFNNLSKGASGAEWSFGNGATARDPDPVIVYEEGGVYDVRLIAATDGICFDTLSRQIAINQTPRAGFQYTDERCFPDDEIILEISNPDDHLVEVSELTTGYFQSGRNRYELTAPGDYQVIIESPQGCDTGFVVTVPVFQEVLLEIMPDTSIIFGSSVRLETTLNAADLSLSWRPPETLDDPGAAEPVATPQESTRYVLEAVRGACIYRDSILVSVREANEVIFAPSAFSPNNDGRNDRFILFAGNEVAGIKTLQIFNRWGGMVFEREDLIPGDESSGWDGTYDGQRLNPGVFVYLATIELVDGRKVLYQGDVALVR